MPEFDYINPNFDIENMPCFNNVDGLKDISQYLDFALSSTIKKQIPNVTENYEKKLATDILNRYMNGETVAFTKKYNIRNNMNKIGRERIKNLLLKTLIEKYEYNTRVLHKLNSNDFNDQCATYVTSVAYNGELDENTDWIQNCIPCFIEMYIEDGYGKSMEVKNHREDLCYDDSIAIKALEQLNLEMSLNRIKN